MLRHVPVLADIIRARGLIHPFLNPTPARRSDALSARFNADIFLKPENLQRTGSFKIRGALNRVAELVAEGATSVITASAGNHGQGVGFAANHFGISATVVVPEQASRAKVEALRRLNVDLRFAGHSFDEAQREMLGIAHSTGAPVVSPYDAAVIAGQGTAVYEFIVDVPDLDLLLVPVGAGGLLAGAAVVAKKINPNIRLEQLAEWLTW